MLPCEFPKRYDAMFRHPSCLRGGTSHPVRCAGPACRPIAPSPNDRSTSLYLRAVSRLCDLGGGHQPFRYAAGADASTVPAWWKCWVAEQAIFEGSTLVGPTCLQYTGLDQLANHPQAHPSICQTDTFKQVGRQTVPTFIASDSIQTGAHGEQQQQTDRRTTSFYPQREMTLPDSGKPLHTVRLYNRPVRPCPPLSDDWGTRVYPEVGEAREG